MDRFDDIWKNRFNDGKLPDDDWNTPDDDLVWAGISTHLPAKKDRRFLIWLWLGLGLLLMLLFSVLLLNIGTDRTSQQTENKENNLVISEDMASTNNPLETKTNIAKEFEQSKQPTTKVDSTPKSTTTFISTSAEGEAPINIAEKANLAALLPTSIADTSSINYSNGITAKELVENEIILQEQMVPANPKSQLPFLQWEIQLLERSFEREGLSMVKNNLQVLGEEDKVLKETKWTLGANAGALFWKHRISDQYTTDLEPFEFNYTDEFGWYGNLIVSFFIQKKVEAYGGIQYERIQNSSGHNSTLNYSLQSEDNQGNDYKENLATPYGPAELSFRFAREEEVMGEDIGLWVDFQSKHLINNFSIPLGLRYYPLGDTKKIQPSIEAGVGLNYLNISNAVGNIETNHDIIKYDGSGTSEFEAPNINEFHIDLNVGLGLNYQMNSNTKLQLNYSWRRGLNPIFQQDSYETKIDRHQLSLGLIKSFNVLEK